MSEYQIPFYVLCVVVGILISRLIDVHKEKKQILERLNEIKRAAYE